MLCSDSAYLSTALGTGTGVSSQDWTAKNTVTSNLHVVSLSTVNHAEDSVLLISVPGNWSQRPSYKPTAAEVELEAT